MERRLSAILAVDVVGYSRLMERDEADTFERLRAHRRDLFEPEIAGHHGRVFKLTGDGLLAEFGSVVDAVECAVLLQRKMAERNDGIADDKRIDVRMGVHVGDVIIEGDDRHGDAVNIAARLQQIAESGGICVSGAVVDHVRQKVALRFEPRGEERLKNIAKPVAVHRVALGTTPIAHGRSKRKIRLWATAAALLLVLLATAVAAVLYDHYRDIDLRTAAVDQGIPKVVILPFLEFVDPQGSLPNIGEGIAEAFNSDLSTFPDLAVVSTATSFSLANKSIPEIVRATAATFVIEGSIRVAGENANVTMQLIGGGTDIPQRVVQFDMKTLNAVELQNRVAHRLREELGGTTGFLRKEVEKIAWSRNGSEITEYDYYVRGQTFSLGESPDWPRTYEQLTEGLARYPDSVLLRCKLVLYYIYSADLSTESEKLFEQATGLDKKSRLDEWYYHWAAAEVNSRLGHQRTAVNEAKATIAMAPYDTLSHNVLASVLTRAHLYDEALEWLKFAATDPNPKRWYFDDLVKGFAAAQTWPEAVAFANEQIAVNPPAIKWWYDFLGTAYMRSGQSDKAKEAWKKFAELPDPPQ